MKLEVLKEEMVRAVGMVEKIAGRHMTLPVLQCVLLEAKEKTLTDQIKKDKNNGSINSFLIACWKSML